jgi:hypothetical protein
MFETVKGIDVPGSSYNGHFSWVYVFNNQVTDAQKPTEDDFVPSNNGGGTMKSQGYDSLFKWMNAQIKH